MTRLTSVALIVAGIAVGYALPRPSAMAMAQTPPPRTLPIFTIDGSKYPRAENGKGVVWTAEELRRKYINDPKSSGFDHLQWAPPYRITITRRQPQQPSGAAPTSELHDDKTQIYMIVSGSGTVQLGGTSDVDNSAGPGEHRGGALVGATSYHVKEGDLISIPPMTWHTSWADPGQTMTYVMVHVENRQTIP
jgi:mannose-6-phosphate isomerase-like protein (cupin superfamily)